jgi:16S rRNA (cytosine967-C5)-methyltransferase
VRDAQNGARLRAAAATVIDAVVSHGESLDAALGREEARIPEADRSQLRLFSYGTLRRYWRLGDWLAALLERPLRARDSKIGALLAVGLFQLSETRIPDHAVVKETVEAARRLRRPTHARLVNAVLRRFLRDRIAEAPPSSDEAAYDHPQWLLDVLAADWPDEWQAIVTANNERAPMWLRVNARHGTAQDYLGRLRADGMDGTLSGHARQAVRMSEAVPVSKLPGFGEGQVSVQDAAAQLAAPWLLEGIGGRVLDACAAPGGKSGHLLEAGQGRIALTCLDSDGVRLGDVAENLTRLRLDATLVEGDASEPQAWWDGELYEAILVDAPCSATGVIRRHPDIKLLRRPSDIAGLAARQSRILDALWPLLAPGGRMLYATCSVLAEENGEVVQRFLDTHTDAGEEQALHNSNIRDVMRPKAPGYQVLPGANGMDGFYYAALRKAP